MKAVIYTKYGSPDVLQYTDIEKPTPTDNEVLVKVHSTAVNPLDWHLMRGEPFIARLTEGFFKPKRNILGADIAGTIVQVGKNVTEFNVGDEVFGDIGSSGFAEYTCVNVSDIVLKPQNASFEEAAALPVTGYTAIQGLRNTGNIHTKQKVLINGASGGVGTFAVQYAKYCGTEVTGVCSTRNLDMVREIGADHVIDYTQEDFTQNGQQYDLIFDAIGNRTVSDLKRALKPNGNCVVAGFTSLRLLFGTIIIGGWVSRRTDKTIGLMETAHIDKDDLQLIANLLEQRKVIPVIDRCYPLSETAEAIRYLETMRARGKVIINIA